jgi:hypothetical protein
VWPILQESASHTHMSWVIFFDEDDGVIDANQFCIFVPVTGQIYLFYVSLVSESGFRSTFFNASISAVLSVTYGLGFRSDLLLTSSRC